MHPSHCPYPSDVSRAALVQTWYQRCCWRPEHWELLVFCLPSSGIGRAGGYTAGIPNPGGVQPMKRQTQEVLLAQHLLSALVWNFNLSGTGYSLSVKSFLLLHASKKILWLQGGKLFFQMKLLFTGMLNTLETENCNWKRYEHCLILVLLEDFFNFITDKIFLTFLLLWFL